MSVDKIEKSDVEKQDHAFDGLPRIFVGVVVIVIGVLLLLRNLGIDLGISFPKNWWALFILIPAALAFLKAFERIKRVGHLDSESGGQLTGAIAMSLVAAIFLLRLDWRDWWPVFVILGGLAILLNHRWTRG